MGKDAVIFSPKTENQNNSLIFEINELRSQFTEIQSLNHPQIIEQMTNDFILTPWLNQYKAELVKLDELNQKIEILCKSVNDPAAALLEHYKTREEYLIKIKADLAAAVFAALKIKEQLLQLKDPISKRISLLSPKELKPAHILETRALLKNKLELFLIPLCSLQFNDDNKPEVIKNLLGTFLAALFTNLYHPRNGLNTASIPALCQFIERMLHFQLAVDFGAIHEFGQTFKLILSFWPGPLTESKDLDGLIADIFSNPINNNLQDQLLGMHDLISRN